MGARELTEGQLATVSEGMGYVTRVGNNLERLQDHFRQAQIPLPTDSFRYISEHLDRIHQQLVATVGEHCDALDAKKGGQPGSPPRMDTQRPVKPPTAVGGLRVTGGEPRKGGQ